MVLSKIAPTLTRATLLSKRYFYGSGLSPEILLFAVRLLLLAILLAILLTILRLTILTLASSVTPLTVRPVRAALTTLLALLTWCRLILVVTTATLTATILATLFLSR